MVIFLDIISLILCVICLFLCNKIGRKLHNGKTMILMTLSFACVMAVRILMCLFDIGILLWNPAPLSTVFYFLFTPGLYELYKEIKRVLK